MFLSSTLFFLFSLFLFFISSPPTSGLPPFISSPPTSGLPPFISSPPTSGLPPHRYPLVIDPSGQAVEYLKRQHAEKRVKITSFLDPAFMKHLESALRFGTCLLVQDVENVDPVLNPVLNREFQKTGGRVLVRLGAQDIDFSPSFSMYLTTRDPLHQFTPDVCSRVTFVNFTVTPASLTSQCLSKVLKSERPETDKKRGELLQYYSGQKIRVISQSINSIKQIKILSKETFVNDIFNSHVNKLENYDFIQRLIMSLPRIFFELISVFTILFISVIYIYSDRDFNNFIPFISLITIASLRLIPNFSSISTSIATLKHTYPAFKLIKNEIENSDIYNDKKLLRSTQKEIEFNDIIEIENVSFQYPNTKNKVLENINLKIKFGEIIGIAGKSGEGKSTLLDLIVGLLKPTVGKILIDRKEFASNSNIHWIKNIGYVPQDTYLLDDTIKANIAFGEKKENFNYQNYEEAIKLAQLDKFIDNLKDKENTIVGERGIRLSGGQRQRISLARCFYFKPKLIILDEPTSSLDTENEKKIIDELYALKIKVTLIIISHRYSIFKKCKKLFNLSNKKLNKIDNFNDL